MLQRINLHQPMNRRRNRIFLMENVQVACQIAYSRTDRLKCCISKEKKRCLALLGRFIYRFLKPIILMNKYALHEIAIVHSKEQEGMRTNKKREVRLFKRASLLLLNYVFILHNCAELRQEIREDFPQFAALRKQQLL
jgi:hypothetical protein